MAETVTTGGNVSFQYQKGHTPKLKTEHKKEIEVAYGQAHTRKRKEKKRRVILTAIVILIILILIFGFALLRN